MAASEQGLGLDGLPALVVPGLLLCRLDLADRRGQLRRLVLELPEPGGQVGRRRAVGDLEVSRLDLPLGLLQSGLRGPAPARTTASEGCHSSTSDHRRATAGAASLAGSFEGGRAVERQEIGAGQGAEPDQAGGRPAHRRAATAAFVPAS